ncbi:hypothetical protein ATPR_2200 [Acetobacter tropicalis NBRC 101654]|uniref:Uncharacterized protein n=1 Tax=Acetobacter tropicalis NBRC 101654 TaxID=749388 RepID=F7VFQ1_9PROT|nr:hypothetical protein [Acetobacter tropicalis]GAA09196.1 hypothetical protein ATPR_2200 [Acetobacter tropicalis NBRC 101654]
MGNKIKTQLEQALEEAISVKIYFESLNLLDKSFSEVNDLLDLNEITLSIPGSSTTITTNSYCFNPDDDYSGLLFEFELECEVDNNGYNFDISFWDIEDQTNYEVCFSTGNDFRVELSFNHDGTYKLGLGKNEPNEHYTYDKDKVVKHNIGSNECDLEKDTESFTELHFYLSQQEKGKGKIL